MWPERASMPDHAGAGLDGPMVLVEHRRVESFTANRGWPSSDGADAAAVGAGLGRAEGVGDDQVGRDPR